jgi:hypothetical protein
MKYVLSMFSKKKVLLTIATRAPGKSSPIPFAIASVHARMLSWPKDKQTHPIGHRSTAEYRACYV